VTYKGYAKERKMVGKIDRITQKKIYAEFKQAIDFQQSISLLREILHILCFW
jgi:hypothetical protein